MRKQMERVGHPPITLVGDHHDSSPKTGHKSPDDQVTKEVISDRRFWIVSPNVTNNRKTVSEWRNASVAFQAAFMGYKSDERSHKQSGYKFAHVISEGDIILIARSHGRQPDVVGFGVVKGKFQKRLRGFVAPEKDKGLALFANSRPLFRSLPYHRSCHLSVYWHTLPHFAN